MNATELKYLKSSQLSHIAKSLYAFYLRDLATQNQCVIDLSAIANYLYSESKYFPTVPNFQIAEKCLNELEASGLLRKQSNNDNWQGCVFELPMYIKPVSELPEPPFIMSLKWEPGPSFHKVAILCGLEDSSYTLTDLNSFRHYWCNKNESRNQTSWERAFAQRLLKSRQQRVETRFLNTTHNALDTSKQEIQTVEQNNLSAENLKKMQQQSIDDFNNLFKN